MLPDRVDPRLARRAVEELWPILRVREAVAAYVATSIAYAHSLSPACWSLTLFSDGIGFNVGQIRVLDVGNEIITLYLQGPRTPSNAAGVSFRDPPGAQFYPAVAVPAFRAEIELRHLSRLPADFRTAHNQLIASAAARKRASPFKSSFSPAIIEVFREISGQRIPDPSWHAANAVHTEPPSFDLDEPDDDGGFGDPEMNRQIEIAAVQCVTEAYRTNGWTVVSVERKRCGYDLRCTKRAAERHVEVKGCAAEVVRFIITAKEHAAAFADPLFRAAVVLRALDESRELVEFTAKQLQTSFEYRPIQFRARRISSA